MWIVGGNRRERPCPICTAPIGRVGVAEASSALLGHSQAVYTTEEDTLEAGAQSPDHSTMLVMRHSGPN